MGSLFESVNQSRKVCVSFEQSVSAFHKICFQILNESQIPVEQHLETDLKKHMRSYIFSTLFTKIVYSFLLLCRIFHMLERGQKQGRAAVS